MRLVIPVRASLLSYKNPTGLFPSLKFRTMASVSLRVPGSEKTITVPTGLFINNEFVPSVDSQEVLE